MALKTLTALKVKIGLTADGRHDYPDFGQLPMVQAGLNLSAVPKKDHAKTIDAEVNKYKRPGILTDKESGHADDDVDSPEGQQWGVVLCTEAFALEAVNMYPDQVSRLTEAQLAAFYNNRVMGRMPAERFDNQILEGLERVRRLRVARGLGTAAIDARIDKALDPDDAELGVTKTEDKTWADIKARLKLTYAEPV